MNFLELCRRVAAESRTVDNGLPATVENQRGRLGKIVTWTAEAYVEIQNHRLDWIWMEQAFSVPLVIGQAKMDKSDVNADRLGAWLIGKDPLTGRERLLVVDHSGQFKPVTAMPWAEFRDRYIRSAEAERRDLPRYCAADPLGFLRLWPTPDQAYTLNGLYRPSPQRLSKNDDVPEMPEEHHMIIVWKALITLSAHDEAFPQGGAWHGKWISALSDLTRDQLPEMKFA